MWKYEKKLQYPINIKKKDLRMAKYLVTQYGGSNGELAAAFRYLNQRYTMPDYKGKALLTDIGTEELGHIEMICAMIYQLTKNATIEEIYDIQQQCSGLTFEPKITIELNNTNYPSCAGRTIYMNSYALFMTQSTAFPHELAHALDHSQVGGLSYNGTLTEGFAQYMEYLTAKTISQTNPELQTYIGRGENVVYNIPVLKSTMHFYSFEDDLLNLSRDQYGANSPFGRAKR